MADKIHMDRNIQILWKPIFVHAPLYSLVIFASVLLVQFLQAQDRYIAAEVISVIVDLSVIVSHPIKGGDEVSRNFILVRVLDYFIFVYYDGDLPYSLDWIPVLSLQPYLVLSCPVLSCV